MCIAALPALILVCGRYEGVDERVVQDHMDVELSIGDFVLTGGELGAMVVMDAVTRLLPGVLGGQDSAALDSFADNLLEHGHYTRPPCFEGQSVPEVLVSGHHERIALWRREQALIRTLLKRPELLAGRDLADEERLIMSRWRDQLDRLIGTDRGCGTGG